MGIYRVMQVVLFGLVAAVLAALGFEPTTASPAKASGSTFRLSTVVADPSTNFFPPSPCNTAVTFDATLPLPTTNDSPPASLSATWVH